MDIFKRKLLLSMSLFYSISCEVMITGCILKIEYVFFSGFLIFICCLFLRFAFEEFSKLYLSKPRNHLASDMNHVPSENENALRRKVRFSPYIEIIEDDNPKDISVDSAEELDRISKEYEPENYNIAASYANRENLQQDIFNGMILLEYDCITETSEEIIEINQLSFLGNSSEMLFDGNVFLAVLNKLCCAITNCCNSHNKGESFCMKAHRENSDNFHEAYYQETIL